MSNQNMKKEKGDYPFNGVPIRENVTCSRHEKNNWLHFLLPTYDANYMVNDLSLYVENNKTVGEYKYQVSFTRELTTSNNERIVQKITIPNKLDIKEIYITDVSTKISFRDKNIEDVVIYHSNFDVPYGITYQETQHTNYRQTFLNVTAKNK